MEYLENIVDAGHQFDIGPFLVHDMGERLKASIGLHLAGEVEQAVVAGVLVKIRIVLPHNTLQPMYSRHLSLRMRGMRFRILPFKSQEYMSEA